jgi:2'-5' RNA ligase
MSGHRWRYAWDYPMESGLVVVVPEAEAQVGPVRDKFDPYSGIGVPPHITALYPFFNPEELTDEVARDVAEVLGGLQPFEFRLDRVASFDDAVFYLAPTPPDPFVALTNVLWGRFPDYPPFGGQFETIVPHMTLGHTNHGATMQSSAIFSGIGCPSRRRHEK